MIKKYWIYILFGFSVIVFTVSQFLSNNKSIEFVAKAVKIENGWGAQIFVDKKLYITMDRIPAIQGSKTFISEEQALTVANFAIFKMNKRAVLPQISIKEIDSLGIVR